MQIEVSDNNVTILGNIKSISDFQNIKQNIDNIVAIHNSVVLNIKDSLSITSSVIGYLNKLVLNEWYKHKYECEQRSTIGTIKRPKSIVNFQS